MKKYANDALAARVNTIVARHSARARVADRKNDGKSGYRFANKTADSADLFLYGEISEWWGISANDFVRDLQEVDAKSISLYINSVGGSVFSGFAIYSALVRHSEEKGVTINVVVDGIAASIASVIMCAGDTIKIYEQASVMVHEPWSYAVGSASDLREEADVLDALKDSIIDVYVSRTGGDRADITKWVEDETWMKGSLAVERGFADEVVALKTKRKEGEEEDRAQVAAAYDADHLKAMFANIPADTLEALSAQSANQNRNSLPTTTREFKDFLREHGFSGKQADAIAGNGFKTKTEPRDEAVIEPEKPTTPERRDDAGKREETVAAIVAAANAVAIRAAALNLTR